MARHIIKFEYRDGIKLKRHELVTWCGMSAGNWYFQDASHAILSIDRGTAISPCKKCLKKLKGIIDNELNIQEQTQ